MLTNASFRARPARPWPPARLPVVATQLPLFRNSWPIVLRRARLADMLAGLVLALTAACATAQEPRRGEWPLHGHDATEQRYSPLDRINATNVGSLGLAWSFDSFVVRGRTHRGMQATPLMKDGALYVTGPWSVVYALDAKTGALKWKHDPRVEGAWVRHACCDAVNRGVALHAGAVYVGTLDGWLVALDAKSGAVRWRVDTLVDRKRSYTITGAPRIAGDKIVIGNGGGEMGVRGYVSAFDAASGKLAWRFYTVPGAGADEHPEVTIARRTWSKSARWELGGGGTVWDSMTYDPELGLLYVGVGNGGPWPAWTRNAGERPDNLYLSSILAIDAKTGRLRWHYQTTPGDSWDYTATQNMILADLPLAGGTRKVLMQAPKNGFFYVLDRATGKLLSAEKYTHATWASRVDPKTGRPVVAQSALYNESAKVVWPSTAGGHNWQPMAFSPRTRLVYIPVLEMPMKFSLPLGTFQMLPATTNTAAGTTLPNAKDDAELMRDLPPFTQQSVLKAWDPIARKVAWQSGPMPWWSGGVLVTASDLVFHGSTDGVLRVHAAKSGRVLKQIPTGLAIMAPPISYELDGKQYIAVLAGLGGAMNARIFPGFAALHYQNRERLLVFGLNGRAVDLPVPAQRLPQQPIDASVPTDAQTIALGKQRFAQYCARCHVPGGASQTTNGYPNLWNMAPALGAAFDAIVLDGALSYAGMASFRDVLTAQDTLAIRAYIAADRRAREGGDPRK